jgi:hypothetical protein
MLSSEEQGGDPQERQLSLLVWDDPKMQQQIGTDTFRWIFLLTTDQLCGWTSVAL